MNVMNVDATLRGELTPHRLLLLDDEEAILRPVAKYFRNLGWDVVACEEPEEAEAVLETEAVSVAVLDLALSRFRRGGLDVLRTLRHQHRFLPVVILSAFVSPDVEDEARQLGADAVMKKPVALPELAQIVMALVGGGRS
jgi:two-component system chemotaxis response regulator CheY